MGFISNKKINDEIIDYDYCPICAMNWEEDETICNSKGDICCPDCGYIIETVEELNNV